MEGSSERKLGCCDDAAICPRGIQFSPVWFTPIDIFHSKVLPKLSGRFCDDDNTHYWDMFCEI